MHKFDLTNRDGLDAYFKNLDTNNPILVEYLDGKILDINDKVKNSLMNARINYHLNCHIYPTYINLKVSVEDYFWKRDSNLIDIEGIDIRLKKLWAECGLGNLNFQKGDYIKSNLEKHMSIFDNLGYDNQNVITWHKEILQALERDKYVMTDFYFTSYNNNNKKLLEHIALKSETYNFLNNLQLLNRGFCPITGDKINNRFNYNIYGRYIYLSEKGLQACKDINKLEWKGDNIGYDTFEKLKVQSKQTAKKQASLVVLIITIFSIIISWNITSPNGFLSFLGFILLGFICFYILGWLFNFLWDVFR